MHITHFENMQGVFVFLVFGVTILNVLLIIFN